VTDFLVGTSATIRALGEDLDLAAQSDSTVLISGEVGCGKQDLARLIHARSSHWRAAFNTIHCARAEEYLSELGRFGGTIFLDEIGEMKLPVQERLLTLLERRHIQDASSNRAEAVTLRVIAGTSDRLIERVKEHAFRPDLYYRVNIVHLRIPPLRDRQGDIPVLMSHFFELLSDVHHRPVPDLDACAEAALLEYGWPGNVCELRTVVEGIILTPHRGRIGLENLPQNIARGGRT
jgi:DNA-binding NtrC family response regulator